MEDQRDSEPEAAGFRYDFFEMGRILDIVRDAGGNVPVDFYPVYAPDFLGDRYGIARERRIALYQACSWAFTFRDAHSDWWDDRRAKAKYDRLAEIGELAEKLAGLLMKNDGEARSALSRHFPRLGAGVSAYDAVDAIRALPEAVEKERRRLCDAGLHDMAPLNLLPSENGRNRDDPGTAGGSFIIALGDAFREFFGEPKIMTSEDGEPEGPFVAFVQAVRQSAGHPITASAVKQAWMRARRRSGDKGREN
ncbi:hypothetical protein GCM10011390_10400 [Aureimonas endophytica]|uniref:Uncharacterized protein n=1 Tax=Aureimonas endophytica TaxID=2027858 RepID=A0A916ZFX5_9HYPH|nr:hypothetical protein [Aureimonas endophytica]GGD93568.1 hypothetical protein GCM10011390_10400 [Aureimonas endophytica]